MNFSSHLVAVHTILLLDSFTVIVKVVDFKVWDNSLSLRRTGIATKADHFKFKDNSLSLSTLSSI